MFLSEVNELNEHSISSLRVRAKLKVTGRSCRRVEFS